MWLCVRWVLYVGWNLSLSADLSCFDLAPFAHPASNLLSELLCLIPSRRHRRARRLYEHGGSPKESNAVLMVAVLLHPSFFFPPIDWSHPPILPVEFLSFSLQSTGLTSPSSPLNSFPLNRIETCAGQDAQDGRHDGDSGRRNRGPHHDDCRHHRQPSVRSWLPRVRVWRVFVLWGGRHAGH